MTALTNAQKQAAFRKAQAERGLVQVNVWVPQDRKAEIRHIAAAMCKPPAPPNPAARKRV